MAKKVIRISKLTPEAVDKAIEELREYRRNLQSKVEELTRRLAEIGVDVIKITMSGIDPERAGTDWNASVVSVDAENNTVTAVYRLSGSEVAFIEFSEGVTYGTPPGGYPLDSGKGFGVGTYPGQTHAYNPKGWYYKSKITGEAIHTYGNPAYMPVYHSTEALLLEVGRIAREVFS